MCGSGFLHQHDSVCQTNSQRSVHQASAMALIPTNYTSFFNILIVRVDNQTLYPFHKQREVSTGSKTDGFKSKLKASKRISSWRMKSNNRSWKIFDKHGLWISGKNKQPFFIFSLFASKKILAVSGSSRVELTSIFEAESVPNSDPVPSVIINIARAKYLGTKDLKVRGRAGSGPVFELRAPSVNSF